jgi:hypothetical protein
MNHAITHQSNIKLLTEKLSELTIVRKEVQAHGFSWENELKQKVYGETYD